MSATSEEFDIQDLVQQVRTAAENGATRDDLVRELIADGVPANSARVYVNNALI